MGKSKKRKSHDIQNAKEAKKPKNKSDKKPKVAAAAKKLTNKPTSNAKSSKVNASKKQHDRNPLQTAQRSFLSALPQNIHTQFFSPTHLSPEKRSELWEKQADLGESLVNSYAWATPDARALKVFQHFGPIVEVGCGANAYWANWMNQDGGVDVIAFDVSLDEGGKIGDKKGKDKRDKAKTNSKAGLQIRQGGPEILSTDSDIRDSGRTLFLCYPDEEDYQPPSDGEEDDDEENSERDNEYDPMPKPPISMAAACLEHFTGSTIIHVGELYGDTLSLDQAPWGRSSSNEFQERLAGEYHCILKMRLLNNWLHVRDTLSVWKRSETCCMAFQEEEDEDGEEGSVEEMYYKYIPDDELLPVDRAAPAVAHLLESTHGNRKHEVGNKIADDYDDVDDDSDSDSNDGKQTAGNAW